MLFLQRTQVKFSVPTLSNSEQPVTSKSGNPGSLRAPILTCTYPHRDTSIKRK